MIHGKQEFNITHTINEVTWNNYFEEFYNVKIYRIMTETNSQEEGINNGLKYGGSDLCTS